MSATFLLVGYIICYLCIGIGVGLIFQFKRTQKLWPKNPTKEDKEYYSQIIFRYLKIAIPLILFGFLGQFMLQVADYYANKVPQRWGRLTGAWEKWEEPFLWSMLLSAMLTYGYHANALIRKMRNAKTSVKRRDACKRTLIVYSMIWLISMIVCVTLLLVA
ncbi:MAG: hypothetical protein CMJ19_10895 [Phycisphaeraceae bacterium]|nr:hypothetical protein [Phycisphaeraceae bacterium]